MKFTRREFVKGGVTAFTFGFAAPEFLTDLAFAQADRPQPGRALSRWRQRRAQHAGSLSRQRLLQPPADAGGSGRHRAADRDRLGGQRARAASAADRTEDASSMQGRLAIIQRTGYLNSSRSHFQGFDIWGTANPRLRGHRVARPLPRYAAVAGRSARRLEHDARDAAVADRAHGRRARDHQSGDLRASRARTAATRRCSSGPPRRRSRRICRSIGRISRS